MILIRKSTMVPSMAHVVARPLNPRSLSRFVGLRLSAGRGVPFLRRVAETGIADFSTISKEPREVVWSPVFCTSGSKNQFHWCIGLYPNGIDMISSNHLGLGLTLMDPPLLGIVSEFHAAILDSKGRQHFMKETGRVHIYSGMTLLQRDFIEWIHLLQEPNIFLPNDILTVYVHIGNISMPGEEEVDMLFQPLNSNPDVLLIAKGIEFPAHLELIQNMCPALGSLIKNELRKQSGPEQRDADTRLEIPNMEPTVLHGILCFLYTGSCPKLNEIAECLLPAAVHLQLPDLKKLAEEQLCEGISRENAIRCLALARENHAGKLFSTVMAFLSFNIKEGLHGKDWKAMMEKHPDLLKVKMIATDEADYGDPDEFGSLRKRTTTPEFEHEEFDVNVIPKRLPPFKYVQRIKEHLDKKELKKALNVWEKQMRFEDKARPDPSVFTHLISGCAQAGYTDKAFKLFKQMKEYGFIPRENIYTSLFNACSNSPWPETNGLEHAKKLLDHMRYKGYLPNTINYHAMIKAFGRCGDLKTALSLVDEMVANEHPLTETVFNFLLQGCISRKADGFTHALLIWRKMREKGVHPTIFSFNLLLRAVRDCGVGSDGQSLLQTLINSCQRPHFPLYTPSTIYGSIMRGEDVQDETQPKLEAGGDKALKSVSNEIFLPQVLSESIQVNQGIVAIKSLDRPQDRLGFLGGQSGILLQMGTDGVKPNIQAFSLLIASIPNNSNAEEELLRNMQLHNVKADTDFFNQLIKKQASRHDSQAIKRSLTRMSENSLGPDIVTYGVLALGCRTRNEGNQLLQDMELAGIRCNMEILGALLSNALSQTDFGWALNLMNVARVNSIEPSLMFLNYLEKLRNVAKKSQLQDESENKAPIENKKDSRKKFLFYYTTWLKSMKYEKPLHPWAQFQNTPEPEGNEESSSHNEATSV
ncbi:unnamed protein product [Darwinula stevensoni]|uniref:Pentatricopeptide repeat-containing protein n=1 Tax=Darwinula stevensoni TaxID=69355 RepID=A0A7R9A6A4_9CRUS|nr:unnamed protein product [Darwinula stevensoni]CAG0888542.1 unnamed protein product [Darwinula stevensoni]